MKILDLFCGAGGFSLGFMESGNKLIGVDNWPVAIETYSNNIGETIETDIMDLDVDTIGKVDVLIGSPPCQDFSRLKLEKEMDMTLVKKFIEIRDELNPKWWVMEEVPIVGKLGEKMGLFKARYLQANWFGLPHMRKRLFAGNYPHISIKEISEIEVLTPTAQVRGQCHNEESWNKILKYYCDLRGVEIPEEYTVREIITPDAYAIVMGFPESYKFSGIEKDVYTQIGNAVCPAVSSGIYSVIKKGKGGIFK